MNGTTSIPAAEEILEALDQAGDAAEAARKAEEAFLEADQLATASRNRLWAMTTRIMESFDDVPATDLGNPPANHKILATQAGDSPPDGGKGTVYFTVSPDVAIHKFFRRWNERNEAR